MRKRLLILILLVLFSFGCTRRPVRDDVQTPDGPATHQANVNEEIKSSPGAVDSPYEQQCIDTLIELELHSVDAEQMVATRAEHVELKRFSRSMISEQQSEISSLRKLRSSWFDDRSKAVNLDLAGTGDAARAIDVSKLDPLKENAFDLEFISQMTRYLESIDRLTSDISSKDVRSELKQITQSIAGENASRVEQLKKWEAQWRNI